jgi:hypothetical protein
MTRTLDRSTAMLVVVSLVCVAGIGLSAATIDTANPIGGSEENQVIDPPSPQDATDVGDNVGGSTDGEQGSGSLGSEFGSVTRCVHVLDSTLGALGVLGVILAITGLIYYRYNFAVALFAGWTILPPTMLGYFLVTDCATTGGSFLSNAASGTLSPGQSPISVGTIPPWAMGGFAFLIVGGAVALLYRASGSDEEVHLEEETEIEDVELDEFAAAAGRAADRVDRDPGVLELISKQALQSGDAEEIAIGLSRVDTALEQLNDRENAITRRIAGVLTDEFENEPPLDVDAHATEFVQELEASLAAHRRVLQSAHVPDEPAVTNTLGNE